jgi:3-deoxy-D-manno-octulosonic acid kinase
MTTQTLITKRRFILYDDARTSHASQELFSPRHWDMRQGLRGAAGGRGQTWIVAGEHGDWILRHYRRGGWVARVLTDQYFWTGLSRSRPWREWNLLMELYKKGLPVPQPVAAQLTRHGLLYRGDLITCRIPDSRSLAASLTDAGIGFPPWRRIGACIRRFHDAGVYHADLNAHNILIDNHNEVYLVDFDRGERRSSGTQWQQANLARLQRSLFKLTDPGVIEAQAWPELLTGYNHKTV